MSGQSHPQDDHWLSLVSALGLTPPEPKCDAPTEAKSPEGAPERGDSASLSVLSEETAVPAQQPFCAEAPSEDVPGGIKSDEAPVQQKASLEPRPMTDWDLLAEELGIAPAKETENTSAAAPTSETAAGKNYVTTPQRVQERIEVFERNRPQRPSSPGNAFGEGLVDQSVADTLAPTAQSETFARSARAPASEPDESGESESGRQIEEEDRPAGDRKKRKRRRRKAKTSRPDSELRRPEGNEKAIATNESDSIDQEDAEPAWIDGEDEPDRIASDEPSDKRAGRRSRPPRDSRGEPRKAPPAEGPARPVRVRAERNDDDSFVDEVEDDDLRPAHKQIPTWEQAVGCIIQANIEARSRRGEGSRNRGRSSGRR